MREVAVPGQHQVDAAREQRLLEPAAAQVIAEQAAAQRAHTGMGLDLHQLFDRDIDGDPRGEVWDIGADQRTR
jgi:hypothetical protein